MTVFITDESARAFWDSVDALDGATMPTYFTCLDSATSSVQDLKKCNVPREAIVNRKLHVLVGASELRRSSKHVVAHSHSADLPSGSFRRVSNSVSVVSPEYLFVRMAAKLPLIETVRLGFELCGTYIVAPADHAPNQREPLTTVAKIKRFLKAAGPIPGSKKALVALRHIVQRSNSPMETILCMLLCLSCKYGGYGLPKPKMNHVIKLGKTQAAIAGKSTFKCDLYWPAASYALEYYGREWHTGVEQVAYDARRLGALQFRGIDISIVTYEQLETPEDVEYVARRVARRLGVRLYKPNASCQKARETLHRYLIGTKAWDCKLEV